MTRRQKARHQLSVNNDRCRVYGMCVAEAPELFQLTANGGLRYQRAVDTEQLPEAKAAIRHCPTLAIILEER